MGSTRGHVLISGHVQGVGFRYAASREARLLGLVGWVRNRRDGRVEVVFEGDERAAEEMIAWCRRGPAGSFVDDVVVTWEPPTGAFRSFTIAETE